MKNEKIEIKKGKRGRFIPALFFVLCSLLFVLGCENPYESLPQNTGEETGTFSLEIGGGQAGRTILPPSVQGNFSSYSLEFSSSGRNSVYIYRNNDTIGDPVTLPAATWNLTVTAYISGGSSAQGRMEGIVISAGDNTSRNIELKPIIEEGATGRFTWYISFPFYPDDVAVTIASMTITPLDTETGTPEQTLYFIGGEPLVNSYVSSSSYYGLTLNTGYYRVVFSLTNGERNTSREEYLHIYKSMESRFEYRFTLDHFTVYSVTNGNDSGPGSLRSAIENAASNSTIYVEDGVETITLTSERLYIEKSLTIQGNGVTITPGDSWSSSTGSPLIYIDLSDREVKISRVHFKDGRATYYGAAIYNRGNLTLESCIFSGNQTSSDSTAYGGAIYNNYGTLNVKACTFYNNSSRGTYYYYIYGGAIYNGNNGTLTLTGNLFYGNTIYPMRSDTHRGPVVYNDGTVSSGGYNVSDVALGTGTNQSGWPADATDKYVSRSQVSPLSFRLISDSQTANVIATLPPGYPTIDFYGNLITNGAAAGAVQGMASEYAIDLSVNGDTRGSASITPASNADGFYSGAVTITATPATGYGLYYWLVNDTIAGSFNNSLELFIESHTKVQAVFARIVNNYTSDSETVAGTLRHALTNAQDEDIIYLNGVTPGETTITLASRLPTIDKNLTIFGNGIILTPGGSWSEGESSQLMYIGGYSSINGYNIEVTINRVHFKNGRATNYGAAIRKDTGILTLESCIFSGNQTSDSSAYGGAIYQDYSYGILNIKGCTFYNNASGGYGGAIYNRSGTLTLTGNLFYGNTAYQYPVVYRYGTSSTVSSGGYNVTDVVLGTSYNQSGWTADETDKRVNDTQVLPGSFKTISGRTNVIDTLPPGYPTVDFYGNPITDGASAGAVQGMANGYIIDLGVNGDTKGSAGITTETTADGLYSGAVTITATPEQGYMFYYWLVNDTTTGSFINSLELIIETHTKVQAVFARIVNNYTSDSETVAGTLRHALTNAVADEIIYLSEVTPGITTITLDSRLPTIDKNLTIQGNGVTLTPGGSWTAGPDTQMMYIYNSASWVYVTISRVHFKNGSATNYGAAIRKASGDLTLESCIFSGNQTSGSGAYGGAIYTSGNGNLYVKGCTFYNNHSAPTNNGYGGAIFHSGGTLHLTGNLFYGNTASSGRGPVVYRSGGNNVYVSSSRYNVTDVALGTDNNQSGWTAATGDKYITGNPINTDTFQPTAANGGAVDVITALPAGYPALDFYGDEIMDGAAAGAVQDIVGDTRPVLTGTVTISGMLQTGQTLTALTGSLGGSGTISYQWRRGTTIVGTNSTTYTVVDADVSQTFTLRVTRAENKSYVESLPMLTGTVSVSGTLQTGQVLTANTSNIGGTGTITRQWLRGSTSVGTNSNTYTVVAGDINVTNFTVRITRSGYTGWVQSPPMLSGTLRISGQALAGQTLTADTSSLSGSGAFTYQWMRGTATTDIGTGSTYTIQQDDVGSTINLTVTRAGSSGYQRVTSATVTSHPVLTGTVSISGNMAVGGTLTALTGSLGGSGEMSYQWKRGSTVVGTNSTYTVVAADIGPNISFTLTVTRADNSGSVTSSPMLNGTVGVVGTLQTGETLSAYPELSGSGTITYQWMRGGVNIYNGVSSTYVVVAADVGQNITLTVTRAGSLGSLTSLPVISGYVSITGAARVGQTLSVDTTGLGGSGTISYQWRRDVFDIGTNSTYTVQPDDRGYSIKVWVTRANNSGRVTAASATVIDLSHTINLTIGETHTDSITNVDLSDLYKLVLAQPAVLSVAVTGVTGNSDSYINVKVFDANGEALRSGTLPYKSYIYAPAGTYYIEVAQNLHNYGVGTYTIRVDNLVVPLLEPGISQQSSTTSSNLYRIALGEPGRFTVTRSAGNVQWYDSNMRGLYLLYGSLSASLDLEAGTYYIEITNTSGTYTIQGDFTAAENNEVEPNNTIQQAQSLTSGQEVRGFISIQDGIDYYKYTLTKAGQLALTVNIDSTGGLYSGNVYWYDSNGTQIKSNRYTNNNSGPFNYYMDLEAGTYYIEITPYSANYSGTYNLQGEIYYADNNETEPNNTRETAQLLTLGQRVVGFISYQDNADYYRYDLTQSGRFLFGIDTGSAGGLDVRWYDSNGTQIKTIIINNSTLNYLEYMDLTAGTYYISFTSRSGPTTGTYTLTGAIMP